MQLIKRRREERKRERERERDRERERERGRDVRKSMVVKMNSLCSKDWRA